MSTARLDDLCQRYHLQLMDIVRAGSGSEFVAFVRRDGQELVLKAASDQVQASFGEATALAAWQDSGWVPRLVAELEPGVSLREYAPGKLFAELDDYGCRLAQIVGQGLHDLHSSPPRTLPHLQDWMIGQRDLLVSSPRLSAQRRQAALDALDAVLAGEYPSVLLHGDLRPSNLIATDRGIQFIDPYGYQGPAAFDLVSFAVSTPCADIEHTLNEVLEGYNRPVAGLDQMLSWFAIRHCDFLCAHEQDPWWLKHFITSRWPD